MSLPHNQEVLHKCGGTIIYTWTYTDVCNRTITHVQNVTVTPVLASICKPAS